VNKTMLLALIGVAAGTGAALMLMPRRTRNSITSDARMALDYATDRMQPSARPRRRKAARRSAGKRKLVKRSRRVSRAA
jgi:hypothetical protein